MDLDWPGPWALASAEYGAAADVVHTLGRMVGRVVGWVVFVRGKGEVRDIGTGGWAEAGLGV